LSFQLGRFSHFRRFGRRDRNGTSSPVEWFIERIYLGHELPHSPVPYPAARRPITPTNNLD